MAYNNRLSLSMRMNGIVKVEHQIETSTDRRSILRLYSTKTWLDQGKLEWIDLLIAARKYDRALIIGNYYRFDGTILPKEGSGTPIFFADEDYTVNVGTSSIRPLSLANKLIINSRGMITEVVHHLKHERTLQSVKATAKHRDWNPASNTVSEPLVKTAKWEEFLTDYTINAVMLLTLDLEKVSIGKFLEFRGTLIGYSKAKNRFIVKVRL
ncbi:hypothetical protein DFH28DRAFT_1114500 [Melampsora americana]|nr:hypothetical protein DFH28DRAFT_1114500 [Melampsora americana]